jgi:iron complex transport system substrate-binding protein
VWALDARRLVSQPGPGLVTGIETMAAILHPGLFDPPPTSRALPVG